MNNEGGQGETLLEPHHSRATAAMVGKAIKNDWPIPPNIRQLVVSQMALIVGKSEDERNRIAASKVLVAADAVNARREATEVQEDKPAGQTNIQINVGAMTDGQLDQLCELIDQAAPGTLDGPAPSRGNREMPA